MGFQKKCSIIIDIKTYNVKKYNYLRLKNKTENSSTDTLFKKERAHNFVKLFV